MLVNQLTPAPNQYFDSGSEWRRVSIQVQGPATLYFGDTRASVSTNASDPMQLTGFTITQADGIVQMWWRGAFWAATSVSCPVVIDWR